MWHLMRYAALCRHRILVCALYPPGPKRAEAWERHRHIVKLFYGY